MRINLLFFIALLQYHTGLAEEGLFRVEGDRESLRMIQKQIAAISCAAGWGKRGSGLINFRNADPHVVASIFKVTFLLILYHDRNTYQLKMFLFFKESPSRHK